MPELAPLGEALSETVRACQWRLADGFLRRIMTDEEIAALPQPKTRRKR